MCYACITGGGNKCIIYVVLYVERFQTFLLSACSLVLLKATYVLIFSNIVRHASVRNQENPGDPSIANTYGDNFLNILFTFWSVTLEEIPI